MQESLDVVHAWKAFENMYRCLQFDDDWDEDDGMRFTGIKKLAVQMTWLTIAISLHFLRTGSTVTGRSVSSLDAGSHSTRVMLPAGTTALSCKAQIQSRYILV